MKTIRTKSNSGTTYRKFFLVLLTIAIFSLSPQLFAQTKAESEILSLSKEKFQWQNEGRFDLISNLLDKNAVVVQTDGSIKSKDEYLKYLKSEKSIQSNIEVKGALVRINGSTATLVGKAEVENLNPSTDSFNGLSYTEVYALENNTWKLVAQHSTSILN